jgi:hypothetical protein
MKERKEMNRKIRSYVVVQGEKAIQQQILSGYEPFYGPVIDYRGTIFQAMVFYAEPEPEIVVPVAEDVAPAKKSYKKAKDD